MISKAINMWLITRGKIINDHIHQQSGTTKRTHSHNNFLKFGHHKTVYNNPNILPKSQEKYLSSFEKILLKTPTSAELWNATFQVRSCSGGGTPIALTPPLPLSSLLPNPKHCIVYLCICIFVYLYICIFVYLYFCIFVYV